MGCEIVAGGLGPSCNSVKQIPDSEVIHVERVANIGELDEGIAATDHGVKSPSGKQRLSGLKMVHKTDHSLQHLHQVPASLYPGVFH